MKIQPNHFYTHARRSPYSPLYRSLISITPTHKCRYLHTHTYIQRIKTYCQVIHGVRYKRQGKQQASDWEPELTGTNPLVAQHATAPANCNTALIFYVSAGPASSHSISYNIVYV